MGSGKKIRSSLRKYGVDNHTKEILEFCDSREKLILKEINWITGDILSDPLCMNLMNGGTGGFISEEQQRHRSSCGAQGRINRLVIDEEYAERERKRSSEIMKQNHKAGKMRYDTFKGKTHSEETKEKMRLTKKGQGAGEANSQSGTCWVTKDGISQKIKKEDLEQWLDKGWVRGRK